MKKCVLFFLIVLLCSCSQATPTPIRVIQEVTVTPEDTPIPTETPRPTFTSFPTKTPSLTPTTTPTKTSTPTRTPTITNTPGPSPTSTDTPIPTDTPDVEATATAEIWRKMTHLKGDGFYLVGVDIAPGKWQSTGTKDGCYWERSNAKQDILGNHFGFAGGTVFVHLTDFQIEFDDCGAWIYVEGMEQVLADDATEPKRDGFYTVGVEIEPGQWRSTGNGDSCYWARLDQYQNIIDNHFGNAGGAVTIRSSDYEFGTEGCGRWDYLGP